ncbi:hypothetical protein [Peptococcus simiae]|uniref:hypothetical protein n=1 Tax=Peptococcus simiae TaxID=1643805 RepID=UPI003980294B
MAETWLAMALLPTEDVPRPDLPALPPALAPAGRICRQERGLVVMVVPGPVEEDRAAQLALAQETGGAGVLRYAQGADKASLLAEMARAFALPRGLTGDEAARLDSPPRGEAGPGPLYALTMTSPARQADLLAGAGPYAGEGLVYSRAELGPQAALPALARAVAAGNRFSLNRWPGAFSDLAGHDLCLFGRGLSFAQGAGVLADARALAKEGQAFLQPFAGWLDRNQGRPGLADLALFMEKTPVGAATARHLYSRALDQGNLTLTQLALALVGGKR